MVSRCPKCGHALRAGGQACPECERHRIRRADQQRNRRNHTHIPSVRVTSDNAEKLLAATDDLAEFIEAFTHQMSAYPPSAPRPPALKTAETLMPLLKALLVTVDSQFADVRAALDRKPPRRNGCSNTQFL